MMTEFLLSLLNIKMLAIVILFILILFIAYKEFFKKPTSKDSGKKEKENVKKTNSEAKEISESEKFLELIDSLPMRNAEKESAENLPNSKFLQETFDREFLKNNDTHDSIVLSDEILELAQEAAEKKLGRKVASLIKRVDKKGHIILDMAAINFITGKHSPIIMPDGTIRVLDFLTMEESIELALTEERPLYVVNKEKQIRRISKEELENIVIDEEQLMLQQKISQSNFQIIELQKERDDLQKENQELISRLAQEKDEAKKFKNQAEILIKLHESKNHTINIEEVEELAKKRNVEQLLEDALEKVAATKNDLEKKENQTSLNILETENVKKNEMEDDTNEFVKDFFEINFPKSVEKKKLTEKEIEKISKDFFKFENFINTAENIKEIKERIFISYLMDKYSKTYLLNFNFNLMETELKKYLNFKDYSFSDIEVEKIFEFFKFKIIRNIYFVNKVTSDIYQCDVYQVQVNEYRLMGLMLCSKYTEIFTKEELENDLKKVTNIKKVTRIRKRLDAIYQNNFTKI